jgi:hypothetical protein
MKITQDKLTELESGILSIRTPQLSHRFRVLIGQQYNIISTEVVKCIIDYVNRTLTLEVYQPLIDGGLHKAIQEMCRTNRPIYVDALNGNGEVGHRLQFENTTVNEHKLVLDYAVNGYAVHQITLKFSNVTVFGHDEIIQ